MKPLLTNLCIGLVALSTFIIPATAAQAAGKMHLEDISLIAAAGHLEEAIEELPLLAREDPAIPVGMLLPAIQKVREAATRSGDACADRKGMVDPWCVRQTLLDLMLDDKPGRDGTPSLIHFAAAGWGISEKGALAKIRETQATATPGDFDLDGDVDGRDFYAAMLGGLDEFLKDNNAPAQTREHILLARQLLAAPPERS